jgi:hypothetical protein
MKGCQQPIHIAMMVLIMAACLCSSGLQIPIEELDIQDQIGGGGFALVHRGLWKGTPVAIKTWFDPSMSEQQQQEFRCAAATCAGACNVM